MNWICIDVLLYHVHDYSTRSRYRTCFNGAFCQATAVDGLQDVLISTVNGPTVSSLGDFSTLQIISSPNFGAAQPNYLGSAISRYIPLALCHTFTRFISLRMQV